MIKAERVEGPVQIRVEIPERLAEKLCALVGGICNTNYKDEWSGLFKALNEATPKRKEVFQDLFEARKNGSFTELWLKECDK